jgi:hypothetical protein
LGRNHSIEASGAAAREATKVNEDWLVELCLQVAAAVMQADLTDTELLSSGLQRIIGAHIFSLPRSLHDNGEDWWKLLRGPGSLRGSHTLRVSQVPFLLCGALLAQCKHGSGSFTQATDGLSSTAARLSAWAFAWMRSDNNRLADKAVSRIPL